MPSDNSKLPASMVVLSKPIYVLVEDLFSLRKVSEVKAAEERA